MRHAPRPGGAAPAGSRPSSALRAAGVLLPLLAAAALPAAAAPPDVAAVAPDVPIVRPDGDGPLRTGEPVGFVVSAEAIGKALAAELKKAAAAAGGNPDDWSAEVNGLDAADWWLVDEDLEKTEVRTHFPALVADEGLGSGSGKSTLNWAFRLPTDPGDGHLLVARAKYRWRALRDGAPQGAPVEAEGFGKLHLSALDLTPPRGARLSPDTLHGFCGDPLTAFNDRARALGVAERYPANPDRLVLSVFDDNPAGWDGRTGVLHSRKKVAAFLLVETAVAKAVPRGRGTGPKKNDPYGLYDAIGEEPADGKGEGAFVWSDPIPVAEIEGSSLEVERFGPEAGAFRIGYRAIVPLGGLEAALSARSPAHAKLPLRYAAHAGAAHLGDDARAARHPVPHLRFTFAVTDSSGNMIVPSAELVPDPAVRAKFDAIYAAVNKGRTEPTVGEHGVYGRILVFDAVRPNPVAVVTNTRRGVSGVVTLANCDLCPAPWANDDEEWVFSAAGDTPAMRALPEARRKEIADLLTVAEGDRLVFSIFACDNVSKDHVPPEGGAAPMRGISTPTVGETAGTMRYVTWRIKDAGAVAIEDYVEETAGGAEVHRFPDYAFRRAADGEQAVQFYVNDHSVFRDPAKAAGPPAATPDWFATTNRRAMKLVFKVTKAPETSVERLGNAETSAGPPGK